MHSRMVENVDHFKGSRLQSNPQSRRESVSANKFGFGDNDFNIYDRSFKQNLKTKRDKGQGRSACFNISEVTELGASGAVTQRRENQAQTTRRGQDATRSREPGRKWKRSRKGIGARGRDSWTQVVKGLRHNRLVTLEGAGRRLSDDTVRQLVLHLRKASNLKTIVLKNNQITDKGVELVCSAVKALGVKVIDFSGNPISSGVLIHLWKLAKATKPLTHIIIKNSNISEKILEKKANNFKELGVSLDFK